MFSELASLEASGRPFVVCTVIASAGSTPQKPGSRMAVSDDGTLTGTIGGGAIEKQVIDAAFELMKDPARSSHTLETHLTHDLGMCCGGKMTVFLEKHGLAARLFVFGAGHVAKELASLAHHVGFSVTVVDERPDWLNAERFPHAARKLEQPDVVARSLTGGADTYCCVTTHDHPLDQACVEALVRTPLAYLGVIGSERKALRFRQRMTAGGFSEEEVARFQSPMGVAIAALTPQEIAVSIVAQLISVRRNAR
ncbi:MAG: xanthine dehydrogenase accessory protein XdhC [Archangium sp.]|nr:xanthine dehydrogenase accessory protein XdhC [Archangium sp.]